MPHAMPTKLTEEQTEVLTGLMLGDGTLYRSSPAANTLLCFSRKWDDRGYNEHLYQLFSAFCARKPWHKKFFDRRTEKWYEQSSFTTRNAGAFNHHRERWYSEAKAIPSDFSIEELTPLACAIWFCDDGNVNVKNRLGLKLSTHGFSPDENFRLVSMLKDMFDEHFFIGHDNQHCFIGAADSGCKAFLRYIEQHIPQSMSRKVKWTPEHMSQPKSYGHTRNRKPLEFNEKEKSLLSVMQSGESLSPTAISARMGWVTPSNKTPSGLGRYLKKFHQKGWFQKSGTLHSYKDTVRYQITELGINTLRMKA